jgi:hypothetical protein
MRVFLRSSLLAVALVFVAASVQAQDLTMAVLAEVQPALRPAGFTITYPDPAGGQTRLPANIKALRVTITIDMADKLAVGKTMQWGVWISKDGGSSWIAYAVGGWTSYGPDGYDAGEFGGLNPDPYIELRRADAITGRPLVRAQLIIDHEMTAGIRVESGQ